MEIQEECPIGKEYTVNKHDNEERPELGFIQYRTVMKEEGKFSFTFDRVSYNDEAGSSGEGEVVTLVNTATADAVAVWVSPFPDALFEVKTTDGERLINALIRAYGNHISSDTITADSVAAVASNENGGTLLVAKVTMDSGHDAWRWTVTPSA